MVSGPTASVVIPTYNRFASLQRALESLKRQTLPCERFEVIVVDDGSTDDTGSICREYFPFALRYLPKPNQGATIARNHGAMSSQADILVFMDDDVTVSPQVLEALVETCWRSPNVLATGHLIGCTSGGPSHYATVVRPDQRNIQPAAKCEELSFSECNTELLACKHRDFVALGMLQDPTNGTGWPNWDDVDFGYRAQQNGFRLLRNPHATGYHWDYSMADPRVACQRWYRACKSAVWLFHRHPAIQHHIPMLSDKVPIAWGNDAPMLMARKAARRIVSSRPILPILWAVVAMIERTLPVPALLRRLYFLIQGAYMLYGYQAGLREYSTIGLTGEVTAEHP